MARTWDTPSTHTTNTAFTTARSWSHTVGSGSNRYIFCLIATEDFSTGGGAQTPSSVAYGGNALTLDSIATVSSIQTAAIYSGQDSVCGTAGAHNMVVTYSGEVNAIVAWAASTDNMAQQVKEATGSLVQSTSVSNGTSNITTVSNQALIIAVSGEDEGTAGSGGTVGHSWNVGTEFGDLAIASVGGSAVRYEKSTAGAQAMTDTLSEGVSRLCMVSAAYETINTSPPVNTVPGTQTCSIGVQKAVTGVSVASGTSDITSIQVTVDSPATVTVSNLSSCTVSSGALDSQTFTLSGSAANLNTAIGTLQTDYPAWTDAEAAMGTPPVFSDSVDITILSSDGTLTDSDTITCNWTLASGNGLTRITLDNATIAGIQAEVNAAYYTPVTDSMTTRYIYAQVGDDNGNYDAGIVAITMFVPGPAGEVLHVLARMRRQIRARSDERRHRR